ncbi:MAG: regulatory protein RecX [Lachnospiraceae bacterium]|nr:regulatory protein RecX [Lachnospiraceae bacterium]
MALVRLVPKGKMNAFLSIDGDAVGPVRIKDMQFMSVSDGDDISEEKLTELLRDYVLPAGKKKALDLLLCSERTEFELRKRLQQDGYGESVTETILQYVKQYPYLNDERYALNYLYSYGGKKSMSMLRAGLREKGVSEELIENALAQYEEERRAERAETEMPDEEDLETTTLRGLIRKKIPEGTPITRDQREKICTSFLRKGFSYSTIRHVLSEYPEYEPEDEP